MLCSQGLQGDGDEADPLLVASIPRLVQLAFVGNQKSVPWSLSCPLNQRILEGIDNSNVESDVSPLLPVRKENISRLATLAWQ